MSGGEPVRARHIKAFVERFEPMGLRPDVFLPVYGLTEGTLAVTFAPLEDRLRVDAINRQELACRGRATPLEGGHAPTPHERMHLVSVGQPLPGVRLKIVDERGQEVGERVLGEIAFMGPNAVERGVPAAEDASDGQTRRRGAWVWTGDLGYVAAGRLYVVARAQDSPRGEQGRRLLPAEAELFVDAIDGVRTGSATVFRAGQGAQLVVVFEVQRGAAAAEIAAEVRRQLDHHLALEPDEVCALTPGSVPRTRDGKRRRGLTRTLWEQGRLERGERAGDLDGAVRLLNRARSDLLRMGQRVRRQLGRWLPRD